MATPSVMQLKTRPSPPSSLYSKGTISFLHPGYEAHHVFLRLPRVDFTDTYGVHHQTALVACQIIANNAFENSYLTLDPEGEERVDTPLDGILIMNRYYLILPDSDPSHPYPIVPSFEDWKFPHEQIPDCWPRRGHRGFASCCSITNFAHPLETVYLVPEEEEDWYSRNQMFIYSSNPLDLSIDNQDNVLLLRSDFYRMFDNREFAIVPKIGKDRSSPQYATHILSSAMEGYWPLYNNVVIQHINKASQPYLFARFAWAIFWHVRPFIVSSDWHVHQVDAAITDLGTAYEYTSRFRTKDQLKRRYAIQTSVETKLPTYPYNETFDEESVEGSQSDEATESESDHEYEKQGGGKRRRLSLNPDAEATLSPSVRSETASTSQE